MEQETIDTNIHKRNESCRYYDEFLMKCEMETMLW